MEGVNMEASRNHQVLRKSAHIIRVYVLEPFLMESILSLDLLFLSESQIRISLDKVCSLIQ